MHLAAVIETLGARHAAADHERCAAGVPAEVGSHRVWAREVARFSFHGVLAEGIVEVSPGAIPVDSDEFDQVFRRAESHQAFAQSTTGPFPHGSLINGTFGSNPWPSGVTGTWVDIGHDPVHGFVDAMWYFQNQVSWPEPGVEAQFRVVDIRPHTRQLRLEPSSTRHAGSAWPQRYDWPKRDFRH